MLISICLIFCQFQSNVACKSVAYRKACISTKWFILDVWLGSEHASVTFHKTISFRIMSKITVSHKDKALARMELHRRYLPRKLLTFWEIILDGVFQNFFSTDKSIFKVSNKVTSIASIDALVKYQEIFLCTYLDEWDFCWNIFS